MGYEIAPSAKWLKAAVTAHLARHEIAAAEETAKRLVAAYPADIGPPNAGVSFSDCLNE
jgi:hypothetical protein